MQPVKKLEIVVDALDLDTVVAALEAAGLTSYTVIRDVVGRGDSGVRYGDELSDIFKNSYLMTTCSPESLPAILESIRPILERCGGVCLVSDASWLIH